MELKFYGGGDRQRGKPWHPSGIAFEVIDSDGHVVRNPTPCGRTTSEPAYREQLDRPGGGRPGLGHDAWPYPNASAPVSVPAKGRTGPRTLAERRGRGVADQNDAARVVMSPHARLSGDMSEEAIDVAVLYPTSG